MRRSTFSLLVALCLFAGLHEARAQSAIYFGPRAGFDLVGDVDKWFIGGDARINLTALHLAFNGTFDYYFTSTAFDYAQINLNGLYEFGVENQSFTPYAGVGLGLAICDLPKCSNSLDTGFNLIGGAFLGQGNLRPFGQAQITFAEADLFTLGVGLLIRAGQ